MVEESAVFVVSYYEGGLVPKRARAQCLVHLLQERFAESNVVVRMLVGRPLTGRHVDKPARVDPAERRERTSRDVGVEALPTLQLRRVKRELFDEW